MKHRPARASDLEAIMALVRDAKTFLKTSGVDQWQDDYPEPSDFADDIRDGTCELFFQNGALAGMICVVPGANADYSAIFGGAWIAELPYVSFHRSIVSNKYRGTGISKQMFSYAENKAQKLRVKSIRVDTHRDNRIMRTLLEKRGYIFCGTIYLDGQPEAGVERVAYEKLL